MGEGCKCIMDEKMRNLPSRLIQVDEIWGFVRMKNRTALRNRARNRAGDIWTWVALDAETKLVPTFAVGDRSQYMWQTPLSRIWRLVSLTGFNFPVRHCGNIPMR